jgi:hypothetical protein
MRLLALANGSPAGALRGSDTLTRFGAKLAASTTFASYLGYLGRLYSSGGLATTLSGPAGALCGGDALASLRAHRAASTTLASDLGYFDCLGCLCDLRRLYNSGGLGCGFATAFSGPAGALCGSDALASLRTHGAASTTLAGDRLGGLDLHAGSITTGSGPAGALRGGDALTSFRTKLAAASAFAGIACNGLRSGSSNESGSTGCA